MPADFYAPLATSASVFVEILTALLVSNLSNLKAERHWLNRRLEEIDAKCRGLDSEQIDTEDKTHDIDEPRYVENPGSRRNGVSIASQRSHRWRTFKPTSRAPDGTIEIIAAGSSFGVDGKHSPTNDSDS